MNRMYDFFKVFVVLLVLVCNFICCLPVDPVSSDAFYESYDDDSFENFGLNNSTNLTSGSFAFAYGLCEMQFNYSKIKEFELIIEFDINLNDTNGLNFGDILNKSNNTDLLINCFSKCCNQNKDSCDVFVYNYNTDVCNLFSCRKDCNVTKLSSEEESDRSEFASLKARIKRDNLDFLTRKKRDFNLEDILELIFEDELPLTTTPEIIDYSSPLVTGSDELPIEIEPPIMDLETFLEDIVEGNDYDYVSSFVTTTPPAYGMTTTTTPILLPPITTTTETISQPITTTTETISQPITTATETISQPITTTTETISQPITTTTETISQPIATTTTTATATTTTTTSEIRSNIDTTQTNGMTTSTSNIEAIIMKKRDVDYVKYNSASATTASPQVVEVIPVYEYDNNESVGDVQSNENNSSRDSAQQSSDQQVTVTNGINLGLGKLIEEIKYDVTESPSFVSSSTTTTSVSAETSASTTVTMQATTTTTTSEFPGYDWELKPNVNSNFDGRKAEELDVSVETTNIQETIGQRLYGIKNFIFYENDNNSISASYFAFLVSSVILGVILSCLILIYTFKICFIAWQRRNYNFLPFINSPKYED